MVFGGALACDLMSRKMMKETPMPIKVCRKTIQFSPGGSCARGPWGPKAIQYARNGSESVYVSLVHLQRDVHVKCSILSVVQAAWFERWKFASPSRRIFCDRHLHLKGSTNTTYQPSSPVGSIRANHSSSDRAMPSISPPAPEEACLPIFSQCLRVLDWIWHVEPPYASVGIGGRLERLTQERVYS